MIFCFLIPVLKIRPLSLKTHFPHFFSNRYVTYKSRPPTKVFDVILFDCTLIKSFWYYASSQKIMTHLLQKFNSYCALKKRAIRYVTSDTLRQIRYWNMRALCARNFPRMISKFSKQSVTFITCCSHFLHGYRVRSVRKSFRWSICSKLSSFFARDLVSVFVKMIFR